MTDGAFSLWKNAVIVIKYSLRDYGNSKAIP